MTLDEIWPTLRSLPIDDKRLLVQALNAELDREELTSLIKAAGTYEVRPPFEAHEAAATLQRLLDEEEAKT